MSRFCCSFFVVCGLVGLLLASPGQLAADCGAPGCGAAEAADPAPDYPCAKAHSDGDCADCPHKEICAHHAECPRHKAQAAEASEGCGHKKPEQPQQPSAP